MKKIYKIFKLECLVYLKYKVNKENFIKLYLG